MVAGHVAARRGGCDGAPYVGALLLAHRLAGSYGELEGAFALAGFQGRLVASEARLVLNMVYAHAVRYSTSEQREDFDGWMTCTLDEASAFIAGQERDTARMLADLGRET